MMSRIVPSITTPERGSCSFYKRFTSIRSSSIRSSKQTPPRRGLSYGWRQRLAAAGTMRLRLPLSIRPEYLIRELLLLVGH